MKFLVKNEKDGKLSVTACAEIEKILDNPIDLLARIKRGVVDKIIEEVYAKYKKEVFKKLDTKTIVATVNKKLIDTLKEV